MKEAAKNILSFLGRLGLSAGLMVWLFSNVNWRDILSALKDADVSFLLWAFLIHIFLQFVVLVRWYIFMRALNLEAPLGLVCRYFFIGLFCNLFLPTSIGGDVVKAIGLSRYVGQRPKVFASVVLDRLSGFAGLVIVAIVAYTIGVNMIDAPSVIVPVGILAAMSVVITGMIFNEKIYSFFCGVFKAFPRAHDGLMNMHYDVMLMKGKKRAGFSCVLLSGLIQLFGAYMYYLIALALHLNVSFMHFVIFSPIICAVTFLPSIGGLGVREIGWVYFLAKVGVESGVSAGLSLLSFLFIIIVGLFGGVMYVATVPARRIQCSGEDAASV